MTSFIIVSLLLALAIIGPLLVAVSGRKDVMATVDTYYKECQPVPITLAVQPDEQIPSIEAALEAA